MYPDPDRPRKFGYLDLLLIALVLCAVGYVWYSVSGVLVYQWDWRFLSTVLFSFDELSQSWQMSLLLKGLLGTLKLSLWAMLIATVIGVLFGVLATTKRLLFNIIASTYVGIVRNVPPLVFIFVFYFFISAQIAPLLGIDQWARELGPNTSWLMGWLLGEPALLENMISGIICLSLLEAAYIAEIVRAGILSVPEAQTEAAKSLGLKSSFVFRLVVLPQALKAVSPPLANQFILLVKNSAIVSLISVQELTFVGSEVAISTGRRFETWIMVAVMYFVVCYGLALLFRYLEVKSRRAQAR